MESMKINFHVSSALDQEDLLRTSPFALKRIVLSLLSNAIKFSPEGSAIFLNVEVIGEVVRFAVRDQGQGISPDRIQSIFEKYSRESQPGTKGEKGA